MCCCHYLIESNAGQLEQLEKRQKQRKKVDDPGGDEVSFDAQREGFDVGGGRGMVA